MPDEYAFEPLTEDELVDQLTQRATRVRSSVGSRLVDSFLARDDVASKLSFDSKRERDAAAASATNYARRTHSDVAVHKSGPLELTLINRTKLRPETAELVEKKTRRH